MIREYMCGRVYVGLGGVRVGNGGGACEKSHVGCTENVVNVHVVTI